MFIIHIERYSDNETHNTEKDIEKKQNNHLKIRWLLIRLVESSIQFSNTFIEDILKVYEFAEKNSPCL